MARIAPAAVVGVLAILLGAGWTLLPGTGAPREASVTIPPGTSAAQVSRALDEARVVSSAVGFRWLLRATGSSGLVQAGEYEFQGPASPLEVLRKLRRGEVVLHPITVPEGLRMDEILDLLAAAGVADRDALEAAGRDASAIHDLDPGATDLEGYLFPETYHFPRGYPASQVLGRMVGRFREVVGEAERRRTAELELTIRELVTLASLVEEETAHAPERPLVASVFHNRLEGGMLLQCDPTVIYALVREEQYDGRLLRADLRFDSPYNTYMYPGLPPGPIASPGPEALRAALYPSDTDFYYFVSMNDGTHHFSRRLDEHNQAVDRYQRRGRRR